MRRHGRALVFGDDTRSFLAVVRSLGRAGVEVHAAPLDLTSPSLRSRYIEAVHRISPYTGDGAAWCAALERLLRQYAFDILIPCDERTLLPLDRHRDVFAPLSRLAIPEHDALTVLFDKQRTRDLAISLAVSVAPGRSIGPDDDAATLVHEFGLPLVVKPTKSYSLEKLYVRGRATIYDRESELARAFPEIADGEYIVEACRPGRGGGVSILASNGRVLQSFQHMRARERGGASFYRVSVPVAGELSRAVEKIVAAVGLTGVAMFEFKIATDTGEWVLLEVNARPWGSMPLPLALGIDFPLRWYQLLVDGEESTPRPYRSGIYQRNLLSDLRQIAVSADAEYPGAIAKIAYFLRTAGELSRLAIGREHLDVLVADDPRPGLHEIFATVANGAKRAFARLPGGHALARSRSRAIVRRAMRRTRGQRAVILLLCSGNICRSPFAAALLRRSLFARPEEVEVIAAGLLPRNGASSPDAAISAARAESIDLAPHRSLFLTDEDARRATLVVVFDRHNLDHLRMAHPELSQRAVLLGDFSESGANATEIADPDGGSVATFAKTYDAIAVATSGLAAAIESARGP